MLCSAVFGEEESLFGIVSDRGRFDVAATAQLEATLEALPFRPSEVIRLAARSFKT